MSLNGMGLGMGELFRRRERTNSRIQSLKATLTNADSLVAGKACVYATGSFGRGEAGDFSDLDLFIVGQADGVAREGKPQRSMLSRLDEICVKADLIRVIKEHGIPDFDADGQYLGHHSVDEFIEALGTVEDDVLNTFTGRLLLLLESRPLLGEGVYDGVIKQVVDAYWGDYKGHESEFVPAFFSNDVIRLWRTFCVNYEARTERSPHEKKIKRKIKNYKLKYSRLLTCYSSLIYLLAVYTNRKTVSPVDAVEMMRLSPAQRLESILSDAAFARAHDDIRDLLALYDEFLDKTNVKPSVLFDLFDGDGGRKYMDDAYAFGDSMFEVLNKIGNGNRFHRLIVI